MSKKSKKGYKQIIKSQEPAAVIQSARTSEFNPDYTDVKRDLKRIGVLASTFFVVLIALSFILK